MAVTASAFSARPRRRRPHVLLWLAAAGALVGGSVGMAARAWGLSPVQVTSNSMSPAMVRGDWIVVRDLDDGGRERLGRGDVVLFRYPPGSSGRAVKRVIALGGDRVTITKRTVAVGPRVFRTAGAPNASPRTEIVPRGHVFLLGDNAGASIDSRNFGAVRGDDVVARTVLVLGSANQVLVWTAVAVSVVAAGLVFAVARRS
jgi:signal peptidase I